MRHVGSVFLALFAWLLATGSHWDLVQTFGWGRMIATYSQSMPIAQAIRLTFTADNFCGVCDVVNTARAADATDTAAPPPAPRGGPEKILLALTPTPVVVVAAPTVLHVLPCSTPVGPERRDPPPLRPPRRALA